MPFASQAQRALMYATAAGADTGVPKAVAREFIASDKPGKLPKHKKSDGGGIGSYAFGGGIGAHSGIHLDTTAIPKSHGVPGFSGATFKPPKPEGTTPSTWSERSEARGIDRSGRAGFAAGGGMQMGGVGETAPWTERQESREIDAPQGGFLNSSIAGRTDRLPIAVAADSHVVPADVMSGLGQGNSLSGARILGAALRIGPYGTPHPQEIHGPGPLSHRPPGIPGEVEREMFGYAEGGETTPGISHCLMAGGEMILPPYDWHDDHNWYRGVKSLGEGDLAKGHARLREMTRRVREHTLNFIKHAPPPKK